MKGAIVRQGVNVVALLATLVVNYLAVSLPIGGLTTAQIAARYPIFFLPANFTFGIWGIIYLGLAVFAVQQARPSERSDAHVRQLDVLFPITCVANMAWLFFFQNRAFGLSMVPMLVLLATLIVIYLRLGIGRATVSNLTRWTIHVPFSLYLGWITVATISNATYVLYDAHWSGFGIGGATWAAIMMIVATVITLAFIATRNDIAYALVVIWALYGIANRQAATPSVAVTAIVLAVVIFLALVGTLIFRNRAGQAIRPAVR
jgi:hypothetical protein